MPHGQSWGRAHVNPRSPKLFCPTGVDTVSSRALEATSSAIESAPISQCRPVEARKRTREHMTTTRLTMPNPTDRELVDRARDGDKRSFGELVRRHQQRIHRLAVHMLRDRAEAEDVTQETFIR